MKKLFLSLVAAIVAVTATFAQSSMVATLSHGENITMYYGAYALRDAMNAAGYGDVINLSGGAFQATTINKAVTLRGTGIDDAAPTYITGNFVINLSKDSLRLSMEGIRCTGAIIFQGTWSNPYFLRCQFNVITYTAGSLAANVKNATFANCKITNSFDLRNRSTVQFINSYVEGFQNNSETTAAASFINCLIKPYESGYYPEYIRTTQLLNCIIFQTSNGYNASDKLPSTSIANNCVAIGYDNLFANTAASTNNKRVGWNEYTKVFKTFTGNYSDNETFELADEAKTTYLGSDGTQVGLYGGLLPYSSTPSYPQITKMNVASKTTADGKLSVEIEVSATE
jgi:hypothetical protein